MPQESIFHKLIKSENSYTQLLCNIMKRDREFRRVFLDRFDNQLNALVNASDIRAQVGLHGCGQADILIQSDRLCMVIEIKTESHRDVTGKQRLLDNPATYQGWLRKQKSSGREAWLVFIVPASWKRRIELTREIEDYRRRCSGQGVNVPDLLFWEDIVGLLTGRRQAPLGQEVRLLLEERFGPIAFDKKETASMFSTKLPIQTLLKMNTLIEKLRKESGLPSGKLEIYKGGFGFYLKKKGEEETCWLYFGSWLEFWEDNHYPICFGVEHVPHKVREAFRRSLKQVYKQDATPFGDYLMGVVPEQDLREPNAFEAIVPKLRKIWLSMSEAAE